MNVHTGQQLFVVDGLITDSMQIHTVKVNYSAIIGNVSTDNVMTPVRGASVRVLDDAGGSFTFTETDNGVYSRSMQGEVGKAYHVEIKTANGKTVLSHPAVLSNAPPLLPATVKVFEELTISQTGRSIYNERLSLEMNTDVSNVTDRPYLRWRATGEYEFGEDYPGIISRKICYIKQNIDFNNIKIFDTHELAGVLLTDEPFLITKYDYRYAFQYCFHLYQYSISADEYKYWKNVQDIVNIDGSLLEPPPGTVKGNLYNPDDLNDRILGYFSVAGVFYTRQFSNAISLGFSAPPLCSIWPPQQPECGNCLTIPKSSVTRPEYWEP
ncbi:MAG TPA: DUF4249 domain-containing protein [Saprospiraceae bacterium]|nr:DUF4249 domain-containing protein [Saprospiraceae bacterium]